MTSSQTGGDDDSYIPVILGAVVGVLVFVVLLMVGVVVLVVCILTRRRSTDKWKAKVVSERQLVEDSQRGGISNGIHSAETGECRRSLVGNEVLYSYISTSFLQLTGCMVK